MNLVKKTSLYLEAAYQLRSFNLLGSPFLPKRLFSYPIRNRAAYNEFVIWISQLDLKQARQVIDVGANHGDFSQAAAQFFPNASLLLFEPLPQLKEKLEVLCHHYGARWQLETCALGSENAKMPLFAAENADDIGSLIGFSEQYRAVNPEATSFRSIECLVRPLDEVLKERSIHSVDLLKIDVEGFEMKVLEGAQKTLSRTQALIIEVSLVRNTSEKKATLPDFLTVLENHRFKVIDIIPSWYDEKNHGRPVEFNILARSLDL